MKSEIVTLCLVISLSFLAVVYPSPLGYTTLNDKQPAYKLLNKLIQKVSSTFTGKKRYQLIIFGGVDTAKLTEIGK